MKIIQYRVFHDLPAKGGIPILKSGEKRTKSILLTFVDAAGEWYEDPESAMQKFSKLDGQGPDPISITADSDGIIFLLDTEIAIGHHPQNEHRSTSRLESSVQGFFQQLLHREKFDQTGFIKHHVALCLSKIDLEAAWPYREKPREFASQFFDPDLPDYIYNSCLEKKTEWFGISSTGVVRDENESPMSAVNQDGSIRNSSKLQPYNLLKPIQWLVWKTTDDLDWKP